MQDFLLSGLVIISLTLWITSGVRKCCKAINGKVLVLVCGTAVGIGLSFLANVVTAHIPSGVSLVWWVVLVRGGTAAAAAFGYANYRQWVLAQQPTGLPQTVKATPVTPAATEAAPKLKASSAAAMQR